MEIFDHVIVGGGIIGASTAYHLVRKGSRSVLLLERNELASAASSRAAGLILQASAKSTKTRLAKSTTDIISNLEDETGDLIGHKMVGSIRVATTDQQIDDLELIASDATHSGIPVEWPDRSWVEEKIPWLRTEAHTKLVYFPTDGYVDPYSLTMAYISAARRLGAVIRPRTGVIDIKLENDTVTGVVTEDGLIACRNVIDTCGAWSAVLAQMVGYPLPMAPVRSHYWITEPSETYGGDHPITVLPDVSAYTRPEVGGLLLGVQEPHSRTFDARELPDDPAAFSATDGEEHWRILTDAFDGLSAYFPAIEDARFSSYISGLSAYTPDGEIILGPVPEVSGFYAAAGACGSGIALSAGMGDATSDLALEQRPQFDMKPFRPDRFGPVDPFSQSFQERCAHSRSVKSRR